MMNKPMYNTVTFSDIYSCVDDFLNDYSTIGIPTTIERESARTLFFLLYARYANSPIANYDLEQSKYKIFSTIFQFGPTWEKKLDIQSRLRGLSEDELMRGGKAIYNQAQNPGTEPGTSALEDLSYINQQNTTNYKKSKLDAYAQLWEVLSTDVTGAFLDRFKPIFKKFVAHENPVLYTEDE